MEPGIHYALDPGFYGVRAARSRVVATIVESILARSYAGYQSPKYCDQFPFTPESGPAMCDAMLRVIDRCRKPAPTPIAP